ncbi:hypothetical protein [Stappia indica]|uniref:hypothetical protein n=1 Tax=Stappia indica TaxID=538381 RepID=UPI001CD3EA79|nr:hypothetical protein [Stappia indica]MCA1300559.1 hypothetical protein [Stappia indica]
MSDDIENSVSVEGVRRELKRVLDASEFEASERNRNFLTYIVEETLAGRSDRIKAYSIATSVFKRGDDFDPLQDSIVRIEAARLRRAIEHFYLKNTDPSDLRIEIPKGAYVPEFRLRDQSPPAAEHGSRSLDLEIKLRGPRILVEPFEQDGDCTPCPGIGRKLTRNVIAALTRFTELFVYGFDTTELSDVPGAEGKGPHEFRAEYRLSGSVTVSAESMHVEMLLKRPDGRFIWAYGAEPEIDGELKPQQFNGLCARIAADVTAVIAQRDGILDSQARESSGETPKHFSGYQKILDFQDYWRSLDPALFEPLRRDLERTVVEDPGFAAAYSCLSMLYSDAARYGYDLPQGSPRPLEHALDLADKAIRIAPGSSRAYHARAIAQWFSGMQEESVKSLEIARSFNPNDSELLAELGFRMAMRMEWETGVPLIEEAYARNPLQPGSYRMGLFFYHFTEGRYEKALQETSAIGAPANGYVHLAAAAALRRLGRLGPAREELREVERIIPTLRTRLETDLAFRQIHPDLIEDIVCAIGQIDPGWTPDVRLKRIRSE